MYTAFVGAVAPGQDGMRCALFPISNAAFEGLFPVTGFQSAGFDRCAISWFASRPGGKTYTPSRGWAVDAGMADAPSTSRFIQASSVRPHSGPRASSLG